MNRTGIITLLASLLLLAACSARSAIDNLSSPEDRAFAQSFVDRVRRGEVESLQPMFDPKLWPGSVQDLDRARGSFPARTGTTELISYGSQTSRADGVSNSSRNYLLVTHDGSHWTTTRLDTRVNPDGRQLIMTWSIDGSREMPQEYRLYRAMDGFVRGIAVGGVVALLLAAAVITWLVRRSRRRRDPLASAGH